MTDSGTKDIWMSAVVSDKRYTFFNTPYWYEIYAKYYNKKYNVFIKSKGDDLILIPTFDYYIKKLYKVSYNTAFGTYGTLISNKHLDDDKMELNVLQQLFANKNMDYLSSPYLHVDKTRIDKDHFTQIIKLDSFSENSMTQSHVRALNKARSQNFKVTESNDIEDWKKYYNLYLEVVKLRGEKSTNNYNWKIFELIYKLPEQYRKLWLIKKNNEVHGGGIFFYFNIVNYWHGINSLEIKDLGGSQYLMYSVIENAKSNNYPIFDFNPSGGHEGVVEFKRRFGAEKLFFSSTSFRNKTFNCSKSLFQLFKKR